MDRFIICKGCGESFKYIGRNKAYCSKECYNKQHNSKECICEFCSGKFTTFSSRLGRFCSVDCGNKGKIKDITYFNKEWLEEKYINLGLSLEEISKIVGCSFQTISDWLHKFNIPTRSYGEPSIGNINNYKNKDYLFKSYVLEKKTILEIANEVGISTNGIKNWLILFDIPLRERGKDVSGNRSWMKDPELRYKHSGPNHPCWRGGISKNPKYCDKWTEELREEIRKLFGYKCYLCGDSNNIGRKLSVHHINFDKSAGCFGKKFNLIPLCCSCHVITNLNRWYWFILLINYWVMNPEINFNAVEVTHYE